MTSWMMSESPASVMLKQPTRKNLPQAVPRSMLSMVISWMIRKGKGVTSGEMVDTSAGEHGVVLDL